MRDIAFLRLWCAKEAVLKAHGHGMAFGLDQFELAEDLGALAMSSGPVALGGPWSLREFEPARATSPRSPGGRAVATMHGRASHARFAAPRKALAAEAAPTMRR